MSSQGPSRRGTAEDRWWDEMYAGPAATSPDTGGPAPTPGTVDDWYETATRVIGGPPPEASVDEWFATASAVIGGAEAPGGGASGGGQALPGSVDDWFDTAARAITDPLGLDPVEPVDPVDLVESFDLPPRPAPPVDLTKPEPPQPPQPAVPAPRAAEAAPPEEVRGGPVVDPVGEDWGVLPYVGGRPPTYEAEPTALPAAEPERLAEVVADTVVEGARYGALTLRAASVRGDSARFRGEPRRDHLLVSRFGTGREALLLVTVTSPPRPVAASAEPAPPGEAARRLAAAVGRSRTALVEDLREGATAADRLRYGLRRFVDAAVRHLPAAPPQAMRAAALHALLVPLDPDARLRVAFGTGPGGLLLLLRDGGWRDGYPPVPAPGADEGDAAFRFRAIVPEPGDVLLLAGVGLCEPLLAEPAAAAYLAEQWGRRPPPGTVEFLRQTQVRVKGHAEDRSAVALWES